MNRRKHRRTIVKSHFDRTLFTCCYNNDGSIITFEYGNSEELENLFKNLFIEKPHIKEICEKVL